MCSTIQSIGRSYGQTFLDTYCKAASVKLYDRQHALVAAEMLNHRVVPFFEEWGVPLLRILTGRGTQYCGNREHPEYQLYLAVENIDYSKTQAYSPHTDEKQLARVPLQDCISDALSPRPARRCSAAARQ